MFATVWGLRDTRSTISRREILPCRLMTSRTMRRLYGALDCCVVPRLTIECGGDYIHIQCVNWRGGGPCMEDIAAAARNGGIVRLEEFARCLVTREDAVGD